MTQADVPVGTSESQAAGNARCLLYATGPSAVRLADALQEQLGCPVTWAHEHLSCERWLKEQPFRYVVLEEGLLDADPVFADSVYHLLQGAVLVEINSAVCSASRAVRLVRKAEMQQEQYARAARNAALQSLRGEFTTVITSLLLESELALQSNRTELAPVLSNLIRLAELLYRQMRV